MSARLDLNEGSKKCERALVDKFLLKRFFVNAAPFVCKRLSVCNESVRFEMVRKKD